MKYCSECGSPVSLQPVDGDERPRFVCTTCATTHYQSPVVLVAVYLCVGEEIMWIRRGIEPAVGRWAMPGGFMEHDETPEQAACREVREETEVELDPDSLTLVSVSTIINMAQTHLVFRCHLEEKPRAQTTVEAQEIAWYDELAMPWEALAFPGIEPHVRQVYGWLRDGRFGIRVGFIDRYRSQYKTYFLA